MGILDDIGLTFKGFVDKLHPFYESMYEGSNQSVLGSTLFGGAK